MKKLISILLFSAIYSLSAQFKITNDNKIGIGNMKRILIIFVVNLLFSHFLFAQENSRIITFFNDTLKGKWILQTNCIYEAQHCDTIGRGSEYLIFSSINSQNFVKFTTNGYWNNEYGDSTKLFLPLQTVIGISWAVDDFLSNIYPRTKLCIQNQGLDDVTLLVNNLMGIAKSYIRDKSYTGIHNVITEPVTIYPNPFVDKINVSCDIPNSTNIVSLVIYSTTGALLRKIVITENEQSSKTISLKDLNTGIYIGIVSVNDKWIKKIKLIKK